MKDLSWKYNWELLKNIKALEPDEVAKAVNKGRKVKGSESWCPLKLKGKVERWCQNQKNENTQPAEWEDPNLLPLYHSNSHFLLSLPIYIPQGSKTGGSSFVNNPVKPCFEAF